MQHVVGHRRRVFTFFTQKHYIVMKVTKRIRRMVVKAVHIYVHIYIC